MTTKEELTTHIEFDLCIARIQDTFCQARILQSLVNAREKYMKSRLLNKQMLYELEKVNHRSKL